MAKTAAKKANTEEPVAKEEADTNAAFSKKRMPLPAFSPLNSSKYAASELVSNNVQLLDPTDAMLELLYDGLKGMYWSELYLTDVLPKMAAAASSAELRTAIQNHLAETELQAQRLEGIFEMMGRTPRAKKCAAIEGLGIDGESVVENTDAGTAARDLGIIMASDKVEHHEIAAYTGLIKLAGKLGLTDAAALLEKSLAEEEASSQLLSDLSESNDQISAAFTGTTDESSPE